VLQTRTQYTASFKRHLVLAKAAGGRANGKALTLLWHKADLRTGLYVLHLSPKLAWSISLNPWTAV
jgi:hypothetical protein